MIEKVVKEIKVYIEDEYLDKGIEEIKEFYEIFKSVILNFDELEVKLKKKYIVFVLGYNVVDIYI